MKKIQAFALILFTVFTLSACDKLKPTETQTQKYQIVFNPNVRADTFLLDNENGKVWQLTKFTDVIGEPTVWVPLDVIEGSSGDRISWQDFFKNNSLKQRK